MSILRAHLSALALAVSFAFAVHANAQPVVSQGSTQTPTTVWDYDHGVNPSINVLTTGPYDQEDLYRGARGFPLPGDAQIR